MKVWDRYAEYAIIGGLFWIALFIAVSFVDKSSFLEMVSKTLIKFSEHPAMSNPSLTNAITSFFSTLGVIAVFCTGLLIDIISPIFFTPFEIFYFKRYILEKNCSYIEKVFEGNKSSSAYTDYVMFSTTPILFYKTKYFTQWQSQRHRYIKLLTLLTSYCLKNSESGMLEDLKDRLVLWRTSRALGGSVFLLALIINCLMLVPDLDFKEILIGFLTIIVLWILSGLLAMGQYIRMCNTLKSVMYLIDDKNTSAELPPAKAP